MSVNNSLNCRRCTPHGNAHRPLRLRHSQRHRAGQWRHLTRIDSAGRRPQQLSRPRYFPHLSLNVRGPLHHRPNLNAPLHSPFASSAVHPGHTFDGALHLGTALDSSLHSVCAFADPLRDRANRRDACRMPIGSSFLPYRLGLNSPLRCHLPLPHKPDLGRRSPRRHVRAGPLHLLRNSLAPHRPLHLIGRQSTVYRPLHNLRISHTARHHSTGNHSTGLRRLLYCELGPQPPMHHRRRAGVDRRHRRRARSNRRLRDLTLNCHSPLRHRPNLRHPVHHELRLS